MNNKDSELLLLIIALNTILVLFALTFDISTSLKENNKLLKQIIEIQQCGGETK